MKKFIALLLVIVCAFCAFAEETSDIIAEFEGGYVTFAEVMESYSVYRELYELIYGEEVPSDVELELQSTCAMRLAEEKIIAAYIEGLGTELLSEEEISAAVSQAEAVYADTLQYSIEYYLTEGVSEEEARALAEAELAEYGMDLDSMIAEYVASAEATAEVELIAGEVTVTEDEIAAEYAARVESDMQSYETDPGTYEYFVFYYEDDIFYLPAPVRRLYIPEYEQTLFVSADTGLLDAENLAAVYALSIGETAEICVDELGTVTVQYLGDEAEGALPLSEVRDTVYSDLYYDRLYEQYQANYALIISGVEVTYYFYRLG